MSAKVFLVYYSGDEVERAAAQLEEKYPIPNHYRLEDRLFLVRTEQPTIARNVADAVGLEGDTQESPTGLVFRLNESYAGFEDAAVWEWLRLKS